MIAVERGGSVSRFEKGVRLPTLETTLALEYVLGEPIQSLFAGVAEQVRDSVTSRARTLLENLGETPSKDLAVKLELLSKLARPDDVSIIPIWQEEE